MPAFFWRPVLQPHFRLVIRTHISILSSKQEAYMRQLLSLVLILGLISTACAAEKTKAAPQPKRISAAPSRICFGCVVPTNASQQTEVGKKNAIASFVYQLKHVQASDAARQLSEAIVTASSAQQCNASPIVIVAEKPSNCLILTVPAARAAQIGEIISKIDVEPKQFHVRLKLTRTDADGNRTTTISPQLITLNGQSATIAVGDPENGTTAIEVQVTEAATAEESHAAAGRARVSSIPSLQFRAHLPCPPMFDDSANVRYSNPCDGDSCAAGAVTGCPMERLRALHKVQSTKPTVEWSVKASPKEEATEALPSHRCAADSAADECDGCDACPAGCESCPGECDKCPAYEEDDEQASQCESCPDPHQAARELKAPATLYLGKDLLNFNKAFQQADSHPNLDEEIDAALKQAERMRNWSARPLQVSPPPSMAPPRAILPPQPNETPKLVYPIFKNIGDGIGVPIPPSTADDHASRLCPESECPGVECTSAEDDALPLRQKVDVAVTSSNEPELITMFYHVADIVYLMSGTSFGEKGVKDVSPAIASCKNLILHSVSPMSWECNGGKGTINYFEPDMSFIILQTPEVHAQIRERLKLLRRLADPTPVVWPPAIAPTAGDVEATTPSP